MRVDITITIERVFMMIAGRFTCLCNAESETIVVNGLFVDNIRILFRLMIYYKFALTVR